MEKFKREIFLHDKNWVKNELTITNENWYFSICNYGGQNIFEPKNELQKDLLNIWDTYHLNWQSPWTDKQNKLVRELLKWERYDYAKVADLLSKCKLDWIELSISEYERSNKAIEEYKKQLWYYNSFIKKISNHDKTRLHIIYSPNIWEEKYFEDFKTIAWNSIKIKTLEDWSYKIFPKPSEAKNFFNNILNIKNKINYISYNEDIYLSAKVDNYKWKPFIYWHWWTNIDFPDNFEEDLFNLLDKIQEDEDQYNDRLITDNDLYNEELIDHANDKCNWEVEKLIAACLSCWVAFSWLEYVVSDNWTFWEIEWHDYCIYTDEEANYAHKDYIENFVNDMWFEWFIWWNQIDVDMDNDWCITISKKIEIWPDERWNSLASYDWEERYEVVNWTTYYLYRC